MSIEEILATIQANGRLEEVERECHKQYLEKRMIDNFIPAEIRVNVIKAFEETTSLRDQLCNFQEMQTEMIDVALTELEKKGLDTTIWVYDSDRSTKN